MVMGNSPEMRFIDICHAQGMIDELVLDFLPIASAFCPSKLHQLAFPITDAGKAGEVAMMRTDNACDGIYLSLAVPSILLLFLAEDLGFKVIGKNDLTSYRVCRILLIS